MLHKHKMGFPSLSLTSRPKPLIFKQKSFLKSMGNLKPDVPIRHMGTAQMYNKQIYEERNISSLLPLALPKPVASSVSTNFWLISGATSLAVTGERTRSWVPHHFVSHVMDEIWMDFLRFLRISCFHWDWTKQSINTALPVAVPSKENKHGGNNKAGYTTLVRI